MRPTAPFKPGCERAVQQPLFQQPKKAAGKNFLRMWQPMLAHTSALNKLCIAQAVCNSALAYQDRSSTRCMGACTRILCPKRSSSMGYYCWPQHTICLRASLPERGPAHAVQHHKQTMEVLLMSIRQMSLRALLGCSICRAKFVAPMRPTLADWEVILE